MSNYEPVPESVPTAPAMTRGPSYEQLIAALQAIKRAPDLASAQQLVKTYIDRFGQTFRDADPATNRRPEDWTECVLMNFQRIVWGERDKWSDNLNINLSWVNKATKQRILELAKTDAPHVQFIGASAGMSGELTKSDLRAKLHEEMERLLSSDGANIKQSNVADIVELARGAGLSDAAVTTARKLLVGYREVFTYKSATAPEAELVAEIDWMMPHIDRSVSQGVLTKKFADDLRSRVNAWRTEALPKSREQIEAKKEAANASALEAKVNRAYDLLRKLYELKLSMDARNGWTVRPAFTTRWHHDIATGLIEQVIPALQAAADARDGDGIEAAMKHHWLKELRKTEFANDPVALGKYLEQQNKDGLAQGELLSDLVSLTPIGPAAKLLVATPIEILKLASGQQTLTETFVAIAIKACAGPFDKWMSKLTGWPLFKKAIVSGIRGAVEDAAKNIAKVASDDKLSWDDKLSTWDEILKSAILSGFKDALVSLPKEVFGNVSNEMIQKWLAAFADGVTHFGFKKPMEDELKRFAQEEIARKHAEAKQR